MHKNQLNFVLLTSLAEEMCSNKQTEKTVHLKNMAPLTGCRFDILEYDRRTPNIWAEQKSQLRHLDKYSIANDLRMIYNAHTDQELLAVAKSIKQKINSLVTNVNVATV